MPPQGSVSCPRGGIRQTRGIWSVVARVAIPVRVRAGALAPGFLFDSFNLGITQERG